MKIIVPVDFSRNSIVAAERAFELAQKNQWHIILIHFYTFPEDDTEEEYWELIRDGIRKEMEDLEIYLRPKYPQVSFEAQCVHGTFLKSLKTAIQEFETELLILGTKGASGWKHLAIGSNTYNAIDNIDIPVMAIPESCDVLNVKRIGVLTNFKEAEKDKIKRISDIFSSDAVFHLYHFNEGMIKDFDNKAIEWQQEISDYISSDRVCFVHDTKSGRLDGDDDLIFNIEYFCKNSRIDVLMLIHNKRSFFRKFFTKSLVKNVVHKIEMPLFFYKQ